ncbi:hypothetical protein GQ600_9376 [Phytophthora cactorum]|nr:hypothetical protein GQ600_9376 [Phytophthora cactorum]
MPELQSRNGNSHIVKPRSANCTQRNNTANEGSQGSRGGKRASGGGAGRRRTANEDSSSEDGDVFAVGFEDDTRRQN